MSDDITFQRAAFLQLAPAPQKLGRRRFSAFLDKPHLQSTTLWFSVWAQCVHPTVLLEVADIRLVQKLLPQRLGPRSLGVAMSQLNAMISATCQCSFEQRKGREGKGLGKAGNKFFLINYKIWSPPIKIPNDFFIGVSQWICRPTPQFHSPWDPLGGGPCQLG